MPKTGITIPDVRLSYANLFQPKRPFNNPQGDPKYSATLLVLKSNLTARAIIDQETAQVIEAAVNSKWGGVRPPQPAICIHDGDGPRPSDGSAYGEECRGCWVITASSKQPPIVVDAQTQFITDATQVYSGMWANVNVTFFAYNQAGKKGIGCALNGVQKIRDDTPLSSRMTAEDMFQAIPTAPAPAAPAYPAPQAPAGYPAPAAAPVIDPFTGEVLPQVNYTPAGYPFMGV